MDCYQPIENYGVIGDMNTIALVGLDGSIDFMCFPSFDSPSIFAALLDKDKGGYFKITPCHGESKYKQLYLPDTNVLLTRFLSTDGVGEITDFMPLEELHESKELIRRVTCVRGSLDFIMECKPRFDYARTGHKAERISAHEIVFTGEGEANDASFKLKSTLPLEIDGNDCCIKFTLKTGETADFLLEHHSSATNGSADMEKFIRKSLMDTINYWKKWMSKSTYQGRWMEIVNRSALVLKLMTSRKYGSIIASPTFGLPEDIGGSRNWDYRYTWIRDASFTIYTLLKMGYKREARDFMSWVEEQCKDIGNAGHLSLMYSIDGGKDLKEVELPHLEGYMQSRPVRIGNGAYNQVQLDIYGELLDSVYLYDKYVDTISYSFWKDLTIQVDWVTKNWELEDEGIWEVRGGKKPFLYSRMMCWVALDRAIRIGERHSYPLPEDWRTERDKIFLTIQNEFWDDDLKAFVQYKGAKTVDAATLLMPIVRFIGPKDPRWLSTLKRIETDLVSDSLVYRYRRDDELDGLKGEEGTFSMCTFWYVECLAKAGKINKARLYFEKMLGYANHLGLYAEQLGFRGEHQGNFPQAFTHLGLISAALSLDKQLNDRRNKEINNDEH
jgi:GH15 family glucan-1,4-alpha-glucosidase